MVNEAGETAESETTEMDSATSGAHEDQRGCSSLSKSTARASAAAVARDAAGRFLGASAVVTWGISDPEIAKAIACREGLALASDLLLKKFRVASDCQNVIRSLEEGGMGVYGHVVQEIRARAASFVSVDFVHESRGSNVDAHC